jgi:hypothetical protein
MPKSKHSNITIIINNGHASESEEIEAEADDEVSESDTSSTEVESESEESESEESESDSPPPRKRSRGDTRAELRQQYRKQFMKDSKFSEMPPRQQNAIINCRINLHFYTQKDISLKYYILQSPDFTMAEKCNVISKIEQYEEMDKSDSEYYKLRSWINGFTKIPFGKYREMPVSANDPPETVATYIDSIYAKMNEVV